MKSYRSNKQSGFTLVEILIVVIILGILAAIVIPQFTNASQDARKSSVVSQLQTIRSQIELYKLQHGDNLPDLITDWTPLTNAAVYNGGTTTFGPYMQSKPVNPLNGLSDVVQGASAGTAATKHGFWYDKTGTGKIWAGGSTSGVYSETTATDNVTPIP